MANWLVVRRTDPHEGLFSWIEMVEIPTLTKIVLEYGREGLSFISYSPYNPTTPVFYCHHDEALDATRQFCRQFSKTGDKYAKVVGFLKEHNISL